MQPRQPLPHPVQERLDRLVQQWRPEQPPPYSLPPPLPLVSEPVALRMDARSWRVLIALGAAALTAVVWIWWQGRAQPAAIQPDRLVTPAAASPSVTSLLLIVHVAGAVRHPGLVRLSPGSRVSDAVRMAGGAISARAEGSVNLARVVIDGEQILLVASGVQGGSAAGGRLSLNSATASQLEELPGVGPVLAQRILDYRREHGSISTVDELNEVSGIGDALLSQLRPRVQM